VNYKKRWGKLGESKRKTKEIVGTCRSMGVTIEGKKPSEILKAIDDGEYDAKFS
jgi:large subunit ribosomal protein L11